MTTLLWVALPLFAALGIFAAGHAMLRKRDPRAGMAWVAVCLSLPVLGALLYFFFGINRIKIRAQKLQRQAPAGSRAAAAAIAGAPVVASAAVPGELCELARTSAAVTGRPLVAGNRIEPLHSGEGTYPPMLAAIAAARRTVYLATYIFEMNATGHRFADALVAAAARGVDVRVLVDGFGELYHRPHAGEELRRRGLRVARFLPPRLFPPSLHVNLRNHRKILAVDGEVGFTGGINVGDRYLADALDNPDRTVDLHFRLAGPIVAQMEQTFRDDWVFATGEPAGAPTPPAPAVGEAVCRLVVDGPDEELDQLAIILIGAAAAARRKLAVMTPYFLPERELIGALQAAALRGVEVVVILPAQNNLFYVHWATRKMLWQLLQRGVRVYYQPLPFVHSKLFLVDDQYALIGSANLDPRSLRLNFELGVEVYHPPFARLLGAHFEAVRSRSREVTLAEVDSRPLPVRLGDGLAWLFSPYF